MPIDIDNDVNRNIKTLQTNFLKLTGFILALVTYYIYVKQKEDKSVDLEKLGEYINDSLGGTFFKATISTAVLGGVWRSLKPYTPASLTGDPRVKQTREIEKNIKILIPFLCSEHVQVIKGYFFRLEHRLYTSADIKKDDEVLQYITGLESIVAILKNQYRHKIEGNISNAALDTILEKIDLNLATFEPKIQEILRYKVIKPFISNVHHNLNLAITPILLRGSPGVGKTWFVTNLSQDLDAELMIVNSETSVQYCATFIHYNEFLISNMDLLTRLLHVMGANNKKCGILFIDEVDKLLMPESDNRHVIESILLKMLNADIKINRSQYLGLTFGVTKILVIMAANLSFDQIKSDYTRFFDKDDGGANPRYQAIQDRVIEIIIPDHTLEQKRAIIIPKAEKEFADKKLPFTAADRDYIETMIKNDKEPGSRKLSLHVTNYVANKLADNLIFAGTRWAAKAQPTLQDIAKSNAAAQHAETPESAPRRSRCNFFCFDHG